MDGTVHTTQDGYVIRFERHLNHPIEKVWAALTQPDQIHQWLAEPGEIELRLGGPVRLTLTGMVVDSTITALDPPRLLEYGWHDQSHTGGPVRWELSPEDGGTRLVFTETFPKTVVEGAAEAEWAPPALAGWHLMLDRFSATLDGQHPGLSMDGFQTHHDHYANTFSRSVT
jgi:uncharacterized protein YndB with AHSA1/START domain